jgi:hypothetical protein
MKKLALDNLKVESFTTAPEGEGRKGTVRAHACSSLQLPAPTGEDCSVYWSCVCTPSGQYTCAC